MATFRGPFSCRFFLLFSTCYAFDTNALRSFASGGLNAKHPPCRLVGDKIISVRPDLLLPA
jgi:hypothetical protein